MLIIINICNFADEKNIKPKLHSGTYQHKLC